VSLAWLLVILQEGFCSFTCNRRGVSRWLTIDSLVDEEREGGVDGVDFDTDSDCANIANASMLINV
jgi:hypothetical protein